jgi:hypothetical protein
MEHSLGGRVAKALGIDDREPTAFERSVVDWMGSKNLDRVIIATDMIMSVAPVASAVKDGFEAVTGHNATNGQPLSAFDRGVAVFGVLTLGTGSALIHGTQALSKAAKIVHEGRAIEQAIGGATTVARVAEHGRDVEKISAQVAAANRGGKEVRASISNVHAVSAAEANSAFPKNWDAPYSVHSQVRRFTTEKELKFVRVTVDRPEGGWMVRAEEIAGMTPAEIQKHLALPKVPTHILDVTVPPKTRMQTGFVGPQPKFGVPDRGGIQYQVLDDLPPSAFGPMRPLQ